MDEHAKLMDPTISQFGRHSEKNITVLVTDAASIEHNAKPSSNTKYSRYGGPAKARGLRQRLFKNVLVRYCIYIVPVAAILIIPVVLYATKWRQRTIGGIHGLGLFIYVEILWVSLWIAKLLAAALPFLFQGIGGLFSVGIRKYSLVLKATEIQVSVVLWAAMALLWFPIICVFGGDSWGNHVKSSQPLGMFYNFMRASLGCSALGLLEQLAIQSIAISFHGTQHREKIKYVKATTRAIELLYDASLRRYPDHSPETTKEDYIIHDTTNVQELLKKNAVHQSLRRMFGDLHYFGEHLVSALGHMARDISGNKELMDLTATHAVVEGALERQNGAEALAGRIFKCIVPHSETVLTQQDIADAFESSSTTEEDKSRVFSCLDHDKNGNVSLEEMEMLLIDLHRTRKNMWENAVNIKDAIHALDRVLAFMALIITGFVFAAVFSTWVARNVSIFTTALSALAFALSQTVGEFIASCVLVFVKHPYDVGDRVILNKIEYQIVRISLLYTVFRTIDNDAISQVSNSEIGKTFVDNITRSGPMKERYQFSISAGTSFQDIEKLRVELENFVQAAENCRDYQTDIDIQLLSIGDMKQLDLRVEIKFKVSHSTAACTPTF